MKNIASIVVIALVFFLTLSSCTELWGSLDDPADPKSDNYQGYETIKDPDAIAPVETNSGIIPYVPKLVATKVDGATAYQFRVSASADPEAYLYESAEVAGNEYLPVDCYDLSATITYFWFVRAKVDEIWGAWSTETAMFSLSAVEPDTASPVNAYTTTDTTPAFDWSDVADATGYRLQLSGANDFATTVTDDATLTMSAYTQASALANESTYYWRVMAKNTDGVWSAWTTDRSLTVSTERPSLVTPSDASPISDTTPAFDWSDVVDAVGYRIQISAASDFTTTVTDDATLTISTYTQATALTNEATYYWRVMTKNADGVWSAWTGSRSFTVNFGTISGLSPAPGGTPSASTPLLDWADSPDAVSYVLQIAATEGGLISAPELSASISEYQTTETLAVGDTRWWRVCAVNAATQRAPWSAAASFTIVPPPPPHLLTPADASSTTSVRPDFTWTTVDGAASYELALAMTEELLDGATPAAIASTSWTPASDLAGGTWYWRVRCVNAYGAKGEWSTVWIFARSYSIGGTGPAGGKVFYDKGSVSSGWRYLEAAPSDQSTGIVWHNGVLVATDARATAIGTGETNTATIVSLQGAGYYAASLCENLILGSKDDWFLPSMDELNVMYEHRGVIEDFISDNYWSSSESAGSYAWFQNFDSGNRSVSFKDFNRRVRAIRAF